MVQALKLLLYLNQMDTTMANVLLTHYIEGDLELKAMILDYLVKHGLNDPLGYFPTAMERIATSLEQGQPLRQSESTAETLKTNLSWMEE